MEDNMELPVELPAKKPSGKAWKNVAIWLVILLSGIAIGHAGTMWWLGQRFRHMRKHPEEFTKRFASRIKDGLNLSEEQTRKLTVILENNHKNIVSVLKEGHGKIQQSIKNMKEEVKGILTPEQAAVWEKDFDKFRPKPPGPFPGAKHPRRDNKGDMGMPPPPGMGPGPEDHRGPHGDMNRPGDNQGETK